MSEFEPGPRIYYRGVNEYWQRTVGSTRLCTPEELVHAFASYGWPALSIIDEAGRTVGEIVTTDIGRIEWTMDGYCGPAYPPRPEGP